MNKKEEIPEPSTQGRSTDRGALPLLLAPRLYEYLLRRVFFTPRWIPLFKLLVRGYVRSEPLVQ